MPILNQKHKNNKKTKKRKQIKKSELFLLGSLLVIAGIVILLFNRIQTLRLDVFNDMLINLSDISDVTMIADVPNMEELGDDSDTPPPPAPDFSRFLGVLEIPRINLRRGFFDVNSPHNTVERNIQKIHGSRMPTVERGNLILAAHSGDAHISFFRFLHRLRLGDTAYITYNGQRFEYVIIDIYEVPKTGTVEIRRNHDATVLTLITCTENSNYLQTVYILEMVN